MDRVPRAGLALLDHVGRAQAQPADAWIHQYRFRRSITTTTSCGIEPLVASGRIRYREDIVDGLDNAPEAFIGMLSGATSASSSSGGLTECPGSRRAFDGGPIEIAGLERFTSARPLSLTFGFYLATFRLPPAPFHRREYVPGTTRHPFSVGISNASKGHPMIRLICSDSGDQPT